MKKVVNGLNKTRPTIHNRSIYCGRCNYCKELDAWLNEALEVKKRKRHNAHTVVPTTDWRNRRKTEISKPYWLRGESLKIFRALQFCAMYGGPQEYRDSLIGFTERLI